MVGSHSLTEVWSEYGRGNSIVPKSERERARLIREARATYNSIFPPADPVSEQRDKAPESRTVSDTNRYRTGVLLS